MGYNKKKRFLVLLKNVHRSYLIVHSSFLGAPASPSACYGVRWRSVLRTSAYGAALRMPGARTAAQPQFPALAQCH